MIHSLRRWFGFAVFLTLVFVTLKGCDKDWAKKADRGTVFPDARIELALPDTQTVKQLFPRYVEAASLGGYLHMWGKSGSISAEEAEESKKTFFTWVETENSPGAYQRTVAFSTPRRMERFANITFVFTKDSTESFTKEEWLMFYQWKDVYLPKVFPEASISIETHPAEHTDWEDLLEIERDTGITVPERFKRSVNAFE